VETTLWQVDAVTPDRDTIDAAARIIKNGGLVAFPTETVYGLGANGLDGRAVSKIFEAKQRPADNPLILHIANKKEVFYLAQVVPLLAQVLIDAFWPGPLTLVLPKRNIIPAEITAGLDTVAIRMPKHQVALALIRQAGVPIAAPSANRSGYTSPTSAGHVLDDLNGRIEAILDGGSTGLGLESTVLDVSGPVPEILRPGSITKEQIEELVGPILLDPGLSSATQAPKAPGLKYNHYAPHAEVVLIDGESDNVVRRAVEMVCGYALAGLKTGLLLTDETWDKVEKDHQAAGIQVAYAGRIGSRRELNKIARLIYSELRECDKAGVDIILTETYEDVGLGSALMNRLLKSAGYKIIK